MTQKEETEEIIYDLLWMAIRYAHGRHTYAPYMVRTAVKKIKEIYPDFKLKPDPTLEKKPDEMEHFMNADDYLNDLFKED